MSDYAAKIKAVMLEDLPHSVPLGNSTPRWEIEQWLKTQVMQEDWGMLSVNGDTAYYFKHRRDSIYFALKWIK